MLPRIRAGRRDRFAKSLASRASPAKKSLNPNNCRIWGWPSGWPRVGQLASPWPVPPRFLLNNRPIPKHRNHLRYSMINIRFTQHSARPEDMGLVPSAVSVPYLPTWNSAASNRSSIRSKGSMTINRKGGPRPLEPFQFPRTGSFFPRQSETPPKRSNHSTFVLSGKLFLSPLFAHV